MEVGTMYNVAPEDLMSAGVARDFQAISQDLASQERAVFDDLVRSAIDAAQPVRKHWDFSAPAKIADREIARMIAPKSEAGKQRLRRAFVAAACLEQTGQFIQKLPDSVVSLYPRFYARMADYLKSPEVYSDDDYAKDVRYAENMLVPARLLAVDLESRAGAKLVLRNLKSPAGLPPALSWLRHRSWGTWYNCHVELRGEMNFTPAGWTDCFQRIADMLELNEHIRGVQAKTWLYDPALIRVSPRLAYIQTTQVENGAFRIRIGPGEEHTQYATQKSETRRKLVESSEYLPTSYALLWPRERLLSWARKVKQDPSLGFAHPPLTVH